MGLFDRFKRITDPVRGTAQVVSVSHPPDSASSGSARMHLAVSVPGTEAFAVEDSYIVKVAKWPRPGQPLPIEASQSDPRKFKILWDEVRTWQEEAADRAQEVVQMMNQAPPPPAPPSPSPPPGTTGLGPADDRVAALARLAALKASGALTEAEFEAEKARILRSP